MTTRRPAPRSPRSSARWLAIIAGSGLERAFDGEPLSIETPWGAVLLARVRIGGRETLFLSRHGTAPRRLPHQIDTRAQAWALQTAGVRAVIAINACGGIRQDLAPGALTLFDDFLDFTRARPQTFAGCPGFDADPERFHLDFSEPYCGTLRESLATAATRSGISLAPPSTYVCVEGPRYETPAEIRMFRQLGGEVVGMTGVPEVVLVRELGICYAGLGVITNRAAGLAAAPLSHREVVAEVERARADLMRLLESVAESLPEEWGCDRCPRTPMASP